jgi:hypothetical protein
LIFGAHRVGAPVTFNVRAHLERNVNTSRSEFRFRPLRMADLPLLHGWIHRPHVARGWSGEGPPTSLDETIEKYSSRIGVESPVKPYIALLNAEPIGFTQSYPQLRAEMAGGKAKRILVYMALTSSWPTQAIWAAVSALAWCRPSCAISLPMSQSPGCRQIRIQPMPVLSDAT